MTTQGGSTIWLEERDDKKISDYKDEIFKELDKMTNDKRQAGIDSSRCAKAASEIVLANLPDPISKPKDDPFVQQAVKCAKKAAQAAVGEHAKQKRLSDHAMDLRSAILCGWAVKETFQRKVKKDDEKTETEADFLSRAEKAGKKAAFVCQSIIDNAAMEADEAAKKAEKAAAAKAKADADAKAAADAIKASEAATNSSKALDDKAAADKAAADASAALTKAKADAKAAADAAMEGQWRGSLHDYIKKINESALPQQAVRLAETSKAVQRLMGQIRDEEDAAKPSKCCPCWCSPARVLPPDPDDRPGSEDLVLLTYKLEKKRNPKRSAHRRTACLSPPSSRNTQPWLSLTMHAPSLSRCSRAHPSLLPL